MNTVWYGKAREEGFDEIADWFETLAKQEAMREDFKL